MIAESSHWKKQLLRDARRLAKIARTKLDLQHFEPDLVQFERIVFLSAYIMRKLSESGKLSSDWNKNRLPCLRFPLRAAIPDALNRSDIDKHYDLNSPTKVSIAPEEFCDRIIHSFIFVPIVGRGDTIDSFYLTSDRMRKHAVWLIGNDDVVDLMRLTGRDYPSAGHFIRGARGQLITWSGHGSPSDGRFKVVEAKVKK